MAKYKAYPEYKDSGVDWCTALPLGWKRTNLRWLSSIYAGGTPSKNVIDYWENGTVPWINSGAVNQSYVTEPSTFISKAAFENSSAKWIPKGALVVALAGQGKTKGMVAQLGINTTCNQSMAAIVFPKDNLSRYIYWWLTSNYQNIRNMAGGDLRDGLNLELLGDIQCPQPNDGECIRISAFLDHETAKIDKLIEKQQQLIELLKEKRQAVISHAVTKGLNPDVPMKDSGVEWLGKVPAHWGVMPVKYVCALIKDGTHLPPPRVENGIPLLSVRNIIGGVFQFRDDDSQISHKDYKSLCSSFVPKKDDVLLAIVGATLGKVALVPEMDSFHIQRSLGVFRTNKLIHPQHLFYIFESKDFQNLLWENAGFSAQPGIYLGTLSNFCVPVPPVTEQLKISEFITATVDKLDLLITQASKLIGLMQERRTALISAAVTGKIDVRDWVAPDTQDIEESQEATV